MIQRVYEQVQQVPLINEVMVATDDERIFQHVQAFGGGVQMTVSTHLSGTDRCAELAAQLPEYDVVINIQGDEPFITPRQIELVVRPLLENAEIAISTLAKAIHSEQELFNPNVVKVVFNSLHKALYFSRSTIPFLRSVPQQQWLQHPVFYKHIGLYGFQRMALLELAQLPPGRLEQLESLEQLRWLEAGFDIAVSLTEEESTGIDTPEDLERLLNK